LKESCGFSEQELLGEISLRHFLHGKPSILGSGDGQKKEYGMPSGSTLKKDADHESHIQDSSIVRAHQHACRAFCKENQSKENMGRSRGGLTTKIHAVVDGLGYPLEIRLTEGQVHDVTQSDLCLQGENSDYVICDKGYDSAEFRSDIEQLGREAVIPPRKNRKSPYEYDKHLYKERHLVENFFCRIKEYRRLSTRYDATSYAFRAFAILASIIIWLRF
jgi:transposase